MLDISISVLGFGGLFCLVWAAGLSLQLPIRTKFIAVYFVGISGFRLVWEAFTLSGFVYRYPEIYSLPVPFLYLIGHSILFYYEKLSGVENWKMSYSHFIPVVIAFLPLFYWIGLNSEQKLLSVQSILNGNWKYRGMVKSKDAMAPEYVSILHRASLLYSSACILLAKFVELSTLSEEINFYSALAAIVFFSFAQVTYFLHALLKDTENQFAKPYRLGNWILPSFLIHMSMALLILGELGGFLILFWGFVRSL